MTNNVEQLTQIKKQATLLFDSEQIEQAIQKLAQQLTRDYAEKEAIFIVVMNGGLIFAGNLLPKLNFPLLIDYCHATRYRGKTSGSNIEWKVKPGQDLRGRHIVIIDDILDEGYTLKAIIDSIQLERPASLKTLVLVEKNHQRKAVPNMRADYCELQTPDEYVFGYGMDYHHYWRNCSQIYYINDTD